jgi:tetratricopeptide (TPR) repeat protein
VSLALTGCSLQPAPIERAALLAEHGRVEDAISVLEEHLAQHPTSHDERKLLIRLHGSAGRLDAAMDQTERLVELLPPASPIPWIELGHAYELAHRYDEALAAYDEAARIAPTDALGPKRGGLRAARWGELRWAEPRLEEAARRAPGDSEVWHALGLVRVGLGELDAARQAYTAGLSADPDAIENHLGLATVALSLNEPRTALEQYEALLRARPSSTDALLGKSWSLILLGELGRAEAVLMDAEARGADAHTIARQRLVMSQRKRKLP